MEIFVTLLVVILILGALIGGKSLGGIIRKGLGCLVLLLLISIGILVFTKSSTKKDAIPQEVDSWSKEHGYFTVKEDCETYTKPDKDSEISGYLKAGHELHIEHVDKFNYFYEVKQDGGRISYVLKENLRKN